MTEDQKKNHAYNTHYLLSRLHKDHVAINIPLEYPLSVPMIYLKAEKIEKTQSHVRHDEKKSWNVHDPEICIDPFIDKMIEHIKDRIKYTDDVLRDAKAWKSSIYKGCK